MWLPILRSLLETTCRLTPNFSASCFCVCESSSSNNSTSSNSFGGFPCYLFSPLCCVDFWKDEIIVHTYFAMEHVHYKPLEVIVTIRQQFSSNEIKKLISFATALCSVQISTCWTQQHNTMHTLFQLIIRACLILVDDTTKWRTVISSWHKLLWGTIYCLKSAFHICTPARREHGENLRMQSK